MDNETKFNKIIHCDCLWLPHGEKWWNGKWSHSDYLQCPTTGTEIY